MLTATDNVTATTSKYQSTETNNLGWILGPVTGGKRENVKLTDAVLYVIVSRLASPSMLHQSFIHIVHVWAYTCTCIGLGGQILYTA